MAVRKEALKLTSSLTISATMIFTALVCVATMVFSIYVPHTEGFFNIGETMVYITALLFGPSVGAFAGGVGSAFADVFLGYTQYALGTLIIKACEGAIVGFLSSKMPRFSSKRRWVLFTFFMGIVVGGLLGIIGSHYYSGLVEAYVGFPPPENPTFVTYIPVEFWYSLGAAVAIMITLMGFIFEPEFGWTIISVFAGGFTMVAGYFLYEQLILGVLAIAEIPINIGQMMVGLLVAIPVIKAVQRYIPYLKG